MNLPQAPDPLAPGSGSASTDIPPAASTLQAKVAELDESLDHLRRWFHVTLAGLILLLAGLNVYLFSQVRVVRGQAFDMVRQMNEMSGAVKAYETNSVPWMDGFTAELHKFAETHPDFAPIMAHYPKPSDEAKAAVHQPAPAAAPAKAPAPAATPRKN